MVESKLRWGVGVGGGRKWREKRKITLRYPCKHSGNAR